MGFIGVFIVLVLSAIIGLLLLFFIVKGTKRIVKKISNKVDDRWKLDEKWEKANTPIKKIRFVVLCILSIFVLYVVGIYALAFIFKVVF